MSESNLYKYFELVKKLSPVTIDLVTSNSDEEFDSAFDNWLTHAIAKLESDKKGFKDLGEDSLSSVLACALSTPELSVTREENSNGHVDLTIKLIFSLIPRTKLGEAKIWRGNEYHIKGLDQLINRYTTGRECRGFVITYVKKPNIRKLFHDLKEHIDQTEPFGLTEPCLEHGDRIRWSFISKHNHMSGEVISICHIGCNLYHPP